MSTQEKTEARRFLRQFKENGGLVSIGLAVFLTGKHRRTIDYHIQRQHLRCYRYMGLRMVPLNQLVDRFVR